MDDPTDFFWKKTKKNIQNDEKLTNEELTHHHVIVSNREEEKKENVEIRNVPSSSAIVFCVMWRTKKREKYFFQTSIKMKEKRAKFSNNN
jgi:hypothetical protein